MALTAVSLVLPFQILKDVWVEKNGKLERK